MSDFDRAVLVHGDPAHEPIPGVILGVRRNTTPLDFLIEFNDGSVEFVPAAHCEKLARNV